MGKEQGVKFLFSIYQLSFDWRFVNVPKVGVALPINKDRYIFHGKQRALLVSGQLQTSRLAGIAWWHLIWMQPNTAVGTIKVTLVAYDKDGKAYTEPLLITLKWWRQPGSGKPIIELIPANRGVIDANGKISRDGGIRR